MPTRRNRLGCCIGEDVDQTVTKLFPNMYGFRTSDQSGPQQTKQDNVLKASDAWQLRQRLREGQSKVPASSAKDDNNFIPLFSEALEGTEEGDCNAFLVPSA